ncbi:hypothetical protein HFO56_03245 [Rhizobium laguerreae]|uniref:hypothetical protein n=1 Tax=Rhizobium laguerreae TaxID=1076926 RepID=UPI001C919E33|nr:hypothetical protein [Rhizobium laguerreae]MBY3151403.1 hypothetical protein [Rhizobium laguerreae]
MFQIRPMNAVADAARHALVQSKSGLVVGEGSSVSWKQRVLPIVRRASGGDVLTPSGTQRLIVASETGAAPSAAEIKAAIANPIASDLAVFDVTPKSGKFLLRVSQIAFGLGLVYLSTGALIGVAMPTGLQYVGLFYGGGYSTATTEKIKGVISDFAVFKEPKIDERTQKFFDAIKAIKAEAKKEQAK